MSEILKTDQPHHIRPGEELDRNRLNAYLHEHAPSVGEVTEITQFPGGFSNLTYCLTTAQKQYVLRRPPFGANIKSAHDMGREFKVLSTLMPHYNKIPQPVIYCEDEQVLGAPFYIMERLEGVILRASNAFKNKPDEQMLHAMSLALVDNLVQLHALDIESTGLVQLGKPEGYVQRQVEGWIKRYYAAETDTIDSMNAVAQWLPKHIPDSADASFLHNDYKFDNVVFDVNDLPRIVGVLDWEMSTVGHPLMDLGASLAYWSEPEDDEHIRFFNLTWLPGCLSRKEVVERYAQKSGRDVSNILFYYVFGLFKNAVIVQQIYARWKMGHTRDERFGKLLPVVVSLGNKAVHVLHTQSF